QGRRMLIAWNKSARVDASPTRRIAQFRRPGSIVGPITSRGQENPAVEEQGCSMLIASGIEVSHDSRGLAHRVVDLNAGGPIGIERRSSRDENSAVGQQVRRVLKA